MKKIKFLFMDVDGTLTDGKIYMSGSGEMFKAFNIKDGCGIKDILPVHSIIPVVITARKSKIVENRCKELDIERLYQGERNKLDKMNEVIKAVSEQDGNEYTLANAAYIGDDILDLACIKAINEHGGMTGCPADAVEEVKEICDFISPLNGGDGAVRNFIDHIVRIKINGN